MELENNIGNESAGLMIKRDSSVLREQIITPVGEYFRAD